MISKVNLFKKTALFPLANSRLFEQAIMYVVNSLPNPIMVANSQVNIILLGDKKMCYYNKKFLNHDYPTDVLAFEGQSDKTLFGEVMVSLQMAQRCAKIYGNTFVEECFLYIIHGLLHLNGFDDQREEDVKQMREQEQQLLNLVKKKFDLSKLFRVC